MFEEKKRRSAPLRIHIGTASAFFVGLVSLSQPLQLRRRLYLPPLLSRRLFPNNHKHNMTRQTDGRTDGRTDRHDRNKQTHIYFRYDSLPKPLQHQILTFKKK